MEINGLPAHVLLVHLVVVMLPLSAAAAVAVSVWPAAQRKLTFLVPLGAVVGTLAVPLTTRAGNELDAKLGNPAFVNHHRDLGNMVLPWAAALAATTVLQWLYLRQGARDALPATHSSLPEPAERDHAVRGRRGSSWLRIGLAVLVIGSAAGTAVIVALTGDAGARAVWGSR
ncbi:hypothetical protein [Pedococcus sp. 5OH_020]|uniref:hypothetical protein n=1 Tax=Pedococcus sp. 5OH_020 TaxID=2989814 RepID=UPI0022E9BDF6|nr:hypothetical protein [Pedococcus sp. 5OH_020]